MCVGWDYRKEIRFWNGVHAFRLDYCIQVSRLCLSRAHWVCLQASLIRSPQKITPTIICSALLQELPLSDDEKILTFRHSFLIHSPYLHLEAETVSNRTHCDHLSLTSSWLQCWNRHSCVEAFMKSEQSWALALKTQLTEANSRPLAMW